MSGWGLVGSRTASAPLETLEELIAGQAMKDEAMRKQAIEQRKLSQDDARIGIDRQRAGYEGERVGLDYGKFDADQKLKAKEQQDFDNLITEAAKSQPWLVPVLKARKMAGVSVSTQDAAMSPEAQHTQNLGDDAAKAAAAAAATAATDARRLKDAKDLKATPSYDDLHPKPNAGPKPVAIPSNVKMKRADMQTIAKMVDSVEALGDKIQWKGVGSTGFGSGLLRGLYKSTTGRGSNEEASLRTEIGNIKGTIAKLRGGAAFTPSEMQMLETYVPTIGEDPSSIKTKLQGLRQWIKFQDDSIKEQFGESEPVMPVGRLYYDAQGNPVKR
jgi:hypothetical protein